MGLSSEQKVTAALRILAYGVAADAIDEYVRCAETTATQILHRFCAAIVKTYQAVYLRSPNEQDLERILAVNEKRGFPGLVGSLDCMHWAWKNCPKAWSGQFKGKEHQPTMVLEAVATRDLWIWHCFFGMPGACNDINVLDRSPLFDDLLSGKMPAVNFTLNDRTYTQGNHTAHPCIAWSHILTGGTGYYLVDGIYPKWSVFVQSFSNPDTEKKAFFSKMQEVVRKDIERAFGVLQGRWHIIAKPAKGWHRSQLQDIMKTCVILHNMIIENQGSAALINVELPKAKPEFNYVPADIVKDKLKEIRDSVSYHRLRSDLVEHLWTWKGTQ